MKTACVAVLLLALVSGCHRAPALSDYGEVPRFRMTDQSGQVISKESLQGNTWAAAFMFTRCPTACPRVTRAMRGVQLDAEKRHVPLRLVSFSVDPDNDSPDVLRRYATEYQADLRSWSFVTGDAKAIRETAEKGFKIAVEGTADPSRADFGIIHGTQLVLVDPAGHIRGFYGTSDAAALAQLVTDAGRLAP